LSILNCSRCGCANESHLENRHETEREWGNDAFSLEEWDTAIRHYSKSIEECRVDARNWSNRSACYAKKGWYEQALYDAEHACSLQPEWYKVWYRKSAAYMGLRRYEEAGKAGREGVKYAQGESEVGMLRQLVKKADDALLSAKKKKRDDSMSDSKNGGGDILNTTRARTGANDGTRYVNHNSHGRNRSSYGDHNHRDTNNHKTRDAEMYGSRQQSEILDDIREDVRLMKKQLDSLTETVFGLQSTMQQFMQRVGHEEKIKATYGKGKETIDVIRDGKEENFDEEGLMEAYEYGQEDDLIINQQHADVEQEENEKQQQEESNEKEKESDLYDSDNDNDIQNEIESMEAAWRDVVQDARALLGSKGNAFFSPLQRPNQEKRKKAEHKATSYKKSKAKLNIDSLDSLFVDLNVSKKSNIDPTGVERFSCSACDNECAEYMNPKLNPQKERILIPNDFSNACDSCGCHFAQHTIFKLPNSNDENAAQSDRFMEEEIKASSCVKEEVNKEKASVSRNNSSSSESHVDIERKRRVQNAIERKKNAEMNGEIIVETTADILSQKERLGCKCCTECPGFKIIYHTSDANNPDVMFYCSLCGCPSDDHKIDEAWEAKETRRKQAEEAQAAARAARQRQWNRSRSSSNTIQSAYDTLNIPFGSSKSVIAKAYKRAALQYHPDKQPRSLSYEQLVERQDKFHQITAAYRSLVD